VKQTVARAAIACLTMSMLMGITTDVHSQSSTRPTSVRDPKDARNAGSTQIRERVDSDPGNQVAEIQRLQAQVNRLDAVIGDLILTLTSRGYLPAQNSQGPALSQTQTSKAGSASAQQSANSASSAGGRPDPTVVQGTQVRPVEREINRPSNQESVRPVARSPEGTTQPQVGGSSSTEQQRRTAASTSSVTSSQQGTSEYEVRLAKALSVEGPESGCGKNSGGGVTTIGPVRFDVKHLRADSSACARAKLVLEQFGRENAAAKFAFTFGDLLILGTYTDLHNGSLYTPPNLTSLMESSKYPEGVDTTSFKSNHQMNPLPHAYSQMIGTGNGTLFTKDEQTQMAQGWLVIPVNGKRADKPFGGLVQVLVRAPAPAFRDIDKVLTPLITGLKAADDSISFLPRDDFLKFSLEMEVPTFVDGREWQLNRGVPKEKESRLR